MSDDERATRRSGSNSESELRDLPAEELERRAHEHVAAMFDKLRAAGESARKSLRPAKFLGKRPLAVAVLGGLAGLFLMRLLFRRRAKAVVPTQGMKAESAGHAFGRSFLSSVGGIAGKALPGVIFYGLARRGWGRAFKRGRRSKE